MMNLYGIFLLFRGSQMKDDWLIPYEQNNYQNDMQAEWDEAKTVPMSVRLPGNTSCSQNLKVALKFATGKPKVDHKAVLFVVAV